ncbi:nose resistant to fluoxetine protein 6-like isoform X2 [Agrilus planipennis]|uniref:Nose resistant to fluoxetine protein 6-like isoform X2 n=1 Tax=Agrilus planipennis TaxID=224129 RepID=A0A1W4WHC2_AGRPL|nr:nose resistant to fluoxetine protein 6-like isoform X2 [Agrilus planipennis]
MFFVLTMDFHKLLFVFYLVSVFKKGYYSQSLAKEMMQVLLENVKTPANSSEMCQTQLNELWSSFINGEQWAWKMLDASSKIPSGYQEGNYRDLGNFDECININHQGRSTIKGKYCYSGIVTVLPRYINLTTSIGSYNHTDFNYLNPIISSIQNSQLKPVLKNESFITSLVEYTKARAVGDLNLDQILNLINNYGLIITSLSLCLPHHCVPSELPLPQFALGFDRICVTEESFYKLDASDYAAIIILVLIALVMLVSTIYDIHLKIEDKKPGHKIFIAYSVLTNGKILFNTSKSSNHLLCLEGLKTLSIFWIILGHRYSSSEDIFAINFNEIQTIAKQLQSQYVQAAQYAVDTFLVLSGCLLTYLAIKPMTEFRNKIANHSILKKAFTITSYTLSSYMHRYLRLTPPVAALFVYYVTLSRRLGNGPVYNFITDRQRQPCVDNWWSFFLYIENYAHTSEMCITHTWYINVDMQMFIFSPLLLWSIVLYRKKMLFIGLPLLIIISTVVVFLIMYINEILWYSQSFYDKYYYVTHTHLAPWFIGMVLGIVLYNSKNKKLQMNKLLTTSIWCIVLLAIPNLILAQCDPSYNYERFKTSIWTALHKPAFAFCIFWIVFACENGYGGIINKFLSSSIFQIFSRLAYSMYLIQFIPMLLDLTQIRAPIYFNHYTMTRAFLADLVLTTILAIIWTLAFELPIRAIDKIIFGKDSTIQVNFMESIVYKCRLNI